MISLTDVSKVYRTPGGIQVEALRDITLHVAGGEFVSVMGPSGSGKSTLMNLIGALDRPSSGEYALDGQPLTDMTPRELARVRNRAIGFVFQQFRLLPRMTAVENVEVPLAYAGVPGRQRRERALAALERVGLGHRALHRPVELSGGEQQRVAIARALVNAPAVLLADEPTGALDSRSGAVVLHLFQDLHAQGLTVLMVTHDADVARHGTRLVTMRDGRLDADRVIPDRLQAADRLAAPEVASA